MEWDVAGRSVRQNYEFLCGAVAPRPIAWITTVNAAGLVNAAPFSWFNALNSDPPMVMVAIADRKSGPKDTLRNLRDMGELVVNVVPAAVAPMMVATSADYPADVSEVQALGLATVPSVKVRPPRLAMSPVHMEAVVHDIQRIGNAPHTNLVLARIVHLHAEDAVLGPDGFPDPRKLVLAGRLGHTFYSDTADPVDIPRPGKPV